VIEKVQAIEQELAIEAAAEAADTRHAKDRSVPLQAFDPSGFRDRYEEALMAHLKAKQAGMPPQPKQIPFADAVTLGNGTATVSAHAPSSSGRGLDFHGTEDRWDGAGKERGHQAVRLVSASLSSRRGLDAITDTPAKDWRPASSPSTACSAGFMPTRPSC
jgi:hypothetical protein